MDVMKALHPDLYVVFELDNSAGHRKSREGGLSTASVDIIAGAGGSSKVMGDTVIKEATCLGNHPRGGLSKLRIGRVQSMLFTAEDDPPFKSPDQQKYHSTKKTVDGVVVTKGVTLNKVERQEPLWCLLERHRCRQR